MIDLRKATWGANADRPCALALTVVPSTDKGLGHFDIACARQMIEMRAEVAVGRAGRPEPGEVDRAAISCRKSEIKLSLPHEQSIPSACPIVGVCRFQGAFATTQARGKILYRKSPITH
jgi:hypothetical protein